MTAWGRHFTLRGFCYHRSMNEAKKQLPNIFEYENYRTFLNDAYQSMKSQDKKFSFRFFARICGFTSHSFLRMIMQGKSKLSPDSVDKIAKAFKFNQEQSLFFKNLVYLNQATNSEERQVYAKEILRSQTYRKIHPLRESQYEYFNLWYNTAIRELVGLPGFQEDPKWIAKHLIPRIKAEEAKKSLEDLLKLGLLKRNDEGKLVQADAVVSTPAEVSSAYVANWHREYLKKAAESIDTVSREKRDISAVTLGFSKKNVKIIKEMIANFRKEIVNIALQESERDALYQLNIQFFPLAETDEGNDS
jgi:uncharacterized protein (TIGR02147 family)